MNFMARNDNDEYRANGSYQDETSGSQFPKSSYRRPSSQNITRGKGQGSYSAGSGSKNYVKRYDRVDERPFDPKRRSSTHRGFGNASRDSFAPGTETNARRARDGKARFARSDEPGSYSLDRHQTPRNYSERKKQYGDKPSYERERGKSQDGRYMPDIKNESYKRSDDVDRNDRSGFRKPYSQRAPQQSSKSNARWDKSQGRYSVGRDGREGREGREGRSDSRIRTSSYGRQSSSYERSRDAISSHTPSWGSVARNGARQITMFRPEKGYPDQQWSARGKSVSYRRKDSDFTNKAHTNGATGNAYNKDFSGEESFINSRRDPAEVKHIRKNDVSGYNNLYSGPAKHGQIRTSPKKNTSEERRNASVSGPRSYKRSAPVASKQFSSELKDAIPTRRLARAESILANATRAYERDRLSETLSLLISLGKEALAVPEVAELMGLTLYRQGQWSRALKILSNLAEVTGSFDQHPVLMDINRALGRHRRVEELFEELRQAGVSSDLMAEARIVMAGDLADRGDLKSAIKQMLPAASRPVRNPQMRHLRQWFVLGDLYERSGDVPLARDLYKRVLDADPSMADIADRLAALT